MEIKELSKALEKAVTLDEALNIKKKWNQKYLEPLFQKLGTSSTKEKKEIGKKVNVLKNKGDEVFARFKDLLDGHSSSNTSKSPFSVYPNHYLEKLCFHPLVEIKSILINLFSKYDFLIESGREVVTVQENFENLEVPLDHPSRSETETFFFDKNTLLRPHCTVHSINRLRESNGKEEILKVVTIGNVYRKDDETPRHTHQFTQLDFLWLQKGLDVQSLKYLLITVVQALFGKDKEFRLRNSYFPFTQPSLEVDVRCNCNGCKDCGVCHGTGWIEVLGAGLFKKEILAKAGYSGEYCCLAGGLGLERIAMLKFGIKDIRNLYENNHDFLNYKYGY